MGYLLGQHKRPQGFRTHSKPGMGTLDYRGDICGLLSILIWTIQPENTYINSQQVME